MARLENKIALVTGSARGLGFAIAESFAKEGAKIILNDIDPEALEIAKGKLTEKGIEALTCQASVTDLESVQNMVDEISGKYEKLDVLVNNAGGIDRADLRHMDEEKSARLLELNFNSLIRCTREMFPLLKKSGKASVVNLSSIMASRHLRQLSIYSATKGAVESLTRGMAIEFAAFGIRANFIAPGFVETELTKRFTSNPRLGQALLDRTPLRRFGLPEEIAAGATFLASDESSYMTGNGLTIDGGLGLGVV